MKSEWDDPALAASYAEKLDQVDWYEHEVNMPSLLKLMPADTHTVLDFGSGPGQFTATLAERYDVEGADASSAMVEIAGKAYPLLTFKQWDGMRTYSGSERFDVIFTKLTLHFVSDLNAFAEQAAEILRPHGSVVASVPHPYRTIGKANGAYASGGEYQGPIGQYGLSVRMIHRSLQAYLEPFVHSGFVLSAIDEPVISRSQATKHDAPAEDLELPKRLNFRITRA